jgi:SAM-dependent methyltransferase
LGLARGARDRNGGWGGAIVRVCKIKLSDEARAVLARSTITANSVTLPEQLDRKLYLEIDKVFKSTGGKWNRGKACHVFAGDPRAILGLAVADGEIVDKKKTLQAFYTPSELAIRMARKLGDMGQLGGKRFLEPSAGAGDILWAVVRNSGGMARIRQLVAVEIDPGSVMELQRQRFADLYSTEENFLVVEADFLAWMSRELFDGVAMNPPFHGGQDIDHIKHALGFLRPGGRLVAICANGPKQQEQLKPLCTTWEELPEGTFREAGTNVRTVLLTIDK